MPEIRVAKEGTLSWVNASGSGTSWATASAPASAVMGYCQSFTHDSARTTVQVMDRGVPTHHKEVSKQAISVSFDVLYGVTANYPNNTALGSGHSVPGLLHLEYKATAPEQGGAIYYQLYGVVANTISFAEAENGDTLRFQCVALGMSGPTASGFLG